MALYHFIRTLAFKGSGDARTIVSADDPLPVAIGQSLSVTSATPDTLISGTKTVATGGNTETLVASSTPCQKVLIQALRTNTGLVSVGNATPLTTLAAGEAVEVTIDDLVKISVKPVENGEGVTYLAEAVA